MLQCYIDVIRLINQTRSSYFKMVRKELNNAGLIDISGADAFILWNLGTDRTTTNVLRNKTNQLGCNLNAIIRSLTHRGYVLSERSQQDPRVVEIWLSGKGRAVADRLKAMHNRVLGNAEMDSVSECAVRTLRALEEFWIGQQLETEEGST